MERKVLSVLLVVAIGALLHQIWPLPRLILSVLSALDCRYWLRSEWYIANGILLAGLVAIRYFPQRTASKQSITPNQTADQ
jgi:hypothetical protein